MRPHQVTKLFCESRHQDVRVNHDRSPSTGGGHEVPQRRVERAAGEVLQRAHQRHAERCLARRVNDSNHEPIELCVVHRIAEG
jgi:hypothetical protein